MQQNFILIYLVFISFSIKKNTDIKENRSAFILYILKTSFYTDEIDLQTVVR
jgi:hypothetical protein